jgi:hypothetical protein
MVTLKARIRTDEQAAVSSSNRIAFNERQISRQRDIRRKSSRSDY